MVKAAIFDMDGLLIDSEPLWHHAAKKALKGIGVALTKDDFNKTLGRGITNAIADWYHLKPWKGASRSEIEAIIITDFLELVESQGQAKPGVYDILELLKGKPLPIALASSSKYQIINTVIDTLKIRDYFDVIYSAEHETYSKPHPGVFISTAKLLKVKPRDCLVFEDAPAGVLAAKAAHMQCVAVPEPDVKNHPFIQTADLTLTSLKEFNKTTLVRLEN